MTQRLREKDLQALALKLADAMTLKLREERGIASKHPRPSSGGSLDRSSPAPVDNAGMERGLRAAILAFNRAYVDPDMDTAPRDPAGQEEKVDEGGNPVSAGYDHDDEAEAGDAGTGDGAMGGMGGSRMSPGSAVTSARDQRKGDKMAAEGDPEYADEWADYDGEDPEDQEAANGRHRPPNVKRFAQAKNDQAAFEKSFSDKAKPTETKRAGYKCSQCGESNVVTRYAVTESNAFNALRLTTAKCRSCGGRNVVRAPIGHAYTTEAAATFASRYRRESI